MPRKLGHKQNMNLPHHKALQDVRTRIESAASSVGRKAGEIALIAVSKTFGAEDIAPVLQAGHRAFGENRVQEAIAKWPALKSSSPDVELHLIGPLQTNKAAEAVRLFDVIHTIDRPRIAEAVARLQDGRQCLASCLGENRSDGRDVCERPHPPDFAGLKLNLHRCHRPNLLPPHHQALIGCRDDATVPIHWLSTAQSQL